MTYGSKIAFPFETFAHDEDVVVDVTEADVMNAAWQLIERMMESGVSARRKVTHELRSQRSGQDFAIAYQPVTNAETARVEGYEALAQCDTTEAGGLMAELGEWILEEACHEASGWDPSITLSVSMSPAQLRDRGLPTTVAKLLQSTGLSPARLQLEINEHLSVEECQAVAPMLTALRALGVRIALNDFGTAAANLASLQHLPVDCIKIHRAFIEKLETNETSRAIVRSMLTLAADLGLDVIAKGVETAEQTRFLRNNGCRLVQGYLIARPHATAALRAA